MRFWFEIINLIIDSGKLYADNRGNAVFLLLRKEEKVVGAELRGTTGLRWQGMASGSRKDLGAFYVKSPKSEKMVICESAIDAISYFALHPDCIAISTSGATANPGWLSLFIDKGFEIFCGFDADDTGDRMADRMFNLYPGIKSLPRITFLNEGKLPPEVPVEKHNTEHLSKPRNKLLADVFYKAGFIESWGRGNLEVVNQCLEQELPEPDFIEEYGVFKTVLYKSKWNEEKLKKMELNDRQIKAVLYVKEKGKITNKEYMEIADISKATATRDLRELVEKKVFKQYGTKGQRISYQLIGS